MREGLPSRVPEGRRARPGPGQWAVSAGGAQAIHERHMRAAIRLGWAWGNNGVGGAAEVCAGVGPWVGGTAEWQSCGSEEKETLAVWWSVCVCSVWPLPGGGRTLVGRSLANYCPIR